MKQYKIMLNENNIRKILYLVSRFCNRQGFPKQNLRHINYKLKLRNSIYQKRTLKDLAG
jgi:hypothetical protein